MTAVEGLDFEVEIHTSVPAVQYRVLSEVARANKTTVKALVRECVRRTLVREVVLAEVKPRSRATADETARLVELHKQGWTDSSIARELGRPQPTVSLWRRRLGLESNYAGPPVPRRNR